MILGSAAFRGFCGVLKADCVVCGSGDMHGCLHSKYRNDSIETGLDCRTTLYCMIHSLRDRVFGKDYSYGLVPFYYKNRHYPERDRTNEQV
jgi:hypothetical protein